MNAVAYFSCSGQSKTVAEKLVQRLGFKLIDIQKYGDCKKFESLVAVFPVHCQGLPKTVKRFLKNARAEFFSFIALYGKASAGNAVYEAHKITGKNTVTAAYMPCNHTYNKVDGNAPEVPEEVISKILNPSFIKIPRRLKAPFAGLFPAWRSRRLISVKRNEKCVNCNICGSVCPNNAMNNGAINGKCGRCLKCVYNCPNGALSVKKGLILKRYLKKPKCEKIIIYK